MPSDPIFPADSPEIWFRKLSHRFDDHFVWLEIGQLLAWMSSGSKVKHASQRKNAELHSSGTALATGSSVLSVSWERVVPAVPSPRRSSRLVNSQ